MERLLRFLLRSVLRVLDRAGERFETASGKNFLKFVHESLMDKAVAGKGFAAVDVERAAGHVGDNAPSLLHDEDPRGRVPRIQVEFPETVIASAGYIGEIKGRRARATDTMRAQRDLVVEVNVRVLVALVTGKSSGHQTFRQVRCFRNRDALAIQGCAASLLGREKLVARGIVKNTCDAFAFVFDTERDAEHRITVREVRRTVERIDIPARVAAGFNAGPFFPHHIVRRKFRSDSLQNERFGLAVGNRDQVDIAFVFDGHASAKMFHEKRAGFARDRFHDGK